MRIAWPSRRPSARNPRRIRQLRRFSFHYDETWRAAVAVLCQEASDSRVSAVGRFTGGNHDSGIRKRSTYATREESMPSQAFQESLPFILRWEGGYVNHPNDPGGPTNKGVTQKVYDAWRRRQGLPTCDVKLIEDQEARTFPRRLVEPPERAARRGRPSRVESNSPWTRRCRVRPVSSGLR